MPGRRRTLIAGAAALLLLALAAGPAAARSDWREEKRSLTLSFVAPASNGYSLRVGTAGHRHVWATLEKRSVSVTYRTEGRVNRHGIKADFGPYGSIDVTLRDPRPQPRFSFLPPELRKLIPLPKRECRGRKPQRLVGRMVGAIELEGENGFARVDTDSANGRMHRAYRRLCKRPERRQRRTGDAAEQRLAENPLPFAVLSVVAEADGRRTEFETFGLEAGSKLGRVEGLLSFVSASAEEERGGLLIQRSYFGSAEPGQVWINRRGNLPTRAKLGLDRPFEGTASLTQPRGGPVDWKGDLAVRLPGIPPVPLTGTGVKARVCRLDFGSLLKDCLTGKDLRQLSGSHSQALADVRLSISR
jgi:hypothetical protein